MRREYIIDAIKTSLSSLEAGVEVRLYGSEARGEANDKSDIDLLVLVPKDKVTLQDELEITAPLYDIELKTGVLINALILPKQDWGKTVTPFYENVMHDAVAL
ncbi:MAG: nucleotidyltransferase domain-containing protein [Candidatus Cryptobacteroides sp.]